MVTNCVYNLFNHMFAMEQPAFDDKTTRAENAGGQCIKDLPKLSEMARLTSPFSIKH